MVNHKEAAAFLGISPGTLYNKISRGEGPQRTKNLKGEWEYSPADLAAYKRDNSQVKRAHQK